MKDALSSASAKNGELVDKQIGSAPKATFVAKLEALL